MQLAKGIYANMRQDATNGFGWTRIQWRPLCASLSPLQET